jgi:putative pre-16S rRNA nuclease
MGRLLGVDWGERRIGLALSDETQTLAQPLATLTRRTGRRFPMKDLLAQLERHQVTGVVVGLPLEASGAEGEPARAARALAEDIARRSGRPVNLVDERFTTARVRRAVHEMGGRTEGRAGDVDALAATLLLQHYLDSRRGSSV